MPASVLLPAGLHRVRGLFGSCHLLIQDDRAVIIDAGLIGECARIERLLAGLGLGPDCVDALLLTHGHLDHAGNLAALKARTGAPILAHPAEQSHLDGAYPYSGVARVCGALEAFGRAVIRYRSTRIDHPLADGDELPWWGGLRVVHLPGHTRGHCGFWSARHQLLFLGDLVAIWTWRSTFPPNIFNTDPELLRPSLLRAAALQPALVVPNHYNRWDPAWMAGRFEAFARRKLKTLDPAPARPV